MTEPSDLPGNALADARVLLHSALAATWERVGWTAEGRVHLLPPATIVTPCAWIDAATLSAQGQGLVATWPVLMVVDGHQTDQVRRLDALLAVGWERLEAVDLGNGSHPQVMTAGPDDVDVGGPTARAVTFAVQTPLRPRTLCPTALTDPSTGETTT